MTPRDRLARLHCVNALFHRLTGHDLYLASQLLDAIEAANAERASGASSGETNITHSAALTEKIHELYGALVGGTPDTGFAFCDGAADDAAGPLWLRAELLSAVRRNAPFRQATIVVGNVDGSGEPASGENNATRRARRTVAADRRGIEHAQTVEQLRALAAQRANPRSLVTLVFV